MSLRVREALEPVIDWYQSDKAPDRNTVDIVRDVVSDLVDERAAIGNVQRLAQDAKRLCQEGHPVSAFNLATGVLQALGVGAGISPTPP